MKKILIVGSLLVAMLIMPNISSAATFEEMQAMINSLLEQIKVLQAQQQQSQSTQQWCYDFTYNLNANSRGKEVTQLHTALEKEGFEIAQEEKDSQIFDESTAAAVSGFQEKYRNDILSPYGLKYPTGFVGKSTRAKLNKLYGCSAGQIPAVSTIIVSTSTSLTIVQPLSTSTVPSIIVLSPNGGESWTKGTTQTIKWQDNTPMSMPTCPGGMSCIQAFPVRQYDIRLSQYFPPCTGEVCAAVSAVSYEIAKNVLSSSYSWSVGKTLDGYTYGSGIVPNGPYTIKVCQAGTITCDSSDREFKIWGETTATTTQPSITVLSPNGGEVWGVGKTYNITWKSNGLEQVNINLLSADPVNEGSYRVARLASNISASIGNYSWVVPEKTECLSLPCITLPEHRNHKIEIVDARYGRNSTVSKVYSDTSNATFSIVGATTTTAPSITVLSPNGGEKWEVGKTYSIKWLSQNIPSNSNITIELLKLTKISDTSSRIYGYERYGAAYIGTSINDGVEKWTVPNNIQTGDQYIINISGCNTNVKVSESESGYLCANTIETASFFSIVAATISTTPTTPYIIGVYDNRGLMVDTYTIEGDRFDSALNKVTINGVTKILASNGNKQGGIIYFKLSDFNIIQSGNYVLQISTSEGASNKVNVNVTMPNSPTITVLSPNGGESMKIGETYNISWGMNNSNSNAPIGIYLSAFDEFGGTYITYTITQNYPIYKSPYPWQIPSTINPGKYLIRIVAYPEDKTKTFEDSSNTSFSIVAATTTSTSTQSNLSINQMASALESAKNILIEMAEYLKNR